MSKIIKIISVVMLFSTMSAYAAQALVPNVGPGAGGPGVSWPTPRFIADTSNCMVDQLTGLEWVTSPPAPTMAQTAAAGYINQNFNAGAGTCGHTDWRLPNIAELKSLVNYNDTSSPKDYLTSQGFIGVQTTNYYWSSTAVSSSAGNAWLVGMDYGGVGDAGTGGGYLVWPVRGGQ